MRTVQPDKLFVEEFREMLDMRGGMNPYLDIENIPVPKLPTYKGLKYGKPYKVKGITEEYFNKLNDTEVFLMGKTTLKKRKALSNGEFVVYTNGDYSYEEVSVSEGFIAVHSNKPIGLKNEIVEKGVSKKYKPSAGYKYVDYFEENGERRYIYIIPKSTVYPMNLLSLIVTFNKHSKYYKGTKVAMQRGKYIYVYVIPYEEREDSVYKIVCVKPSIDFTEEYNQLLNYWAMLGEIFDPSITGLTDEIRRGKETINNIAYIDVPDGISEGSYRLMKYSISEIEDRKRENSEKKKYNFSNPVKED